MKTPLEIIEYELAGVEKNIKKLGKPRFYQFKNKWWLNYWKGVRFGMLRIREMIQIEELRK